MSAHYDVPCEIYDLITAELYLPSAELLTQILKRLNYVESF